MSNGSGIWEIGINDDAERIVKVGELPTNVSSSSSLWNQGEYIYNIGGYHYPNSSHVDTIVRFSKKSKDSEIISRTPYPTSQTAAVWNPNNGVAYIFGGFGPMSIRNNILMFNETSGVVTQLDADLPIGILGHCAVLVGHEAFIVGGSTGLPDQFSFTKFDTLTHEVTPLVVENFPHRLYGAGCASVESHNRIYIFGGTYDSYTRDDILYIDMNKYGATTTTTPISTTTEASICPPSGVEDFPHPGNCSIYIRCIQGDPIILTCSPSFWFDKIDKICKPAHQAACDVETPNKCPIDGSYDSFPHESSCSLYHYCYNGELYTDECVANAYYDQNLKSCTYAHEAVCHSECPEHGVLFIPIRSTGCQWYKRCFNGVSVNYDCGNERIYNPKLEHCVNSNAYTCPY